LPEPIPGNAISGFLATFAAANVTCNRLGGFSPLPDEPGFTPDCIANEIRYTNVGTDYGATPTTGPGDMLDLVVTNLTNYIPNEPFRNGRTAEQTGEFGQVNMADDQVTRFKYDFYKTGTNTAHSLSVPFDFFFFDIDVGENGRLAEAITVARALRVTDIEDACREQNQPSPCLSGSVEIINLGGDTFTCIGTERGYGEDNAESPEQILKPVENMTDFEKVAARKYINVSFPAGISTFEVDYQLTAAATPRTSGRNFQYAIFGEFCALPPFPPPSPPSPFPPPPSSPPLPPPPSPPPPPPLPPPPPPSLSPSPSPPPVEEPPPVARKDPHLYLPHGGRADFRGAGNVTFAMLSAKDVAFNVKFEEADFNWAKRIVHGTKMAAAYWTIRTFTGKMLHIEYNASSKLGGIVHEEGKRDVTIMDNSPALVIDNVHVSLENQKLTVEVGGKWLMSAVIAAFPFGNLAANKYKKLLDIGVQALYDADHDVVAPHGIFGQAYDGDNIGVSGKVDTHRTIETTTVAQAEGAIEGIWSDYMVASPFATAFKYSRFDATEAKPRDVSKLSGKKTPMPATAYSVGASDLPEMV